MRNALFEISTRIETSETKYWKNHGYFEYSSFEDAFNIELKKHSVNEKKNEKNVI